MTLRFSRRHALLSAVAAGLVPAHAIARAPRLLAAGTRTIEVNRKAVRVFRLGQPGGEPGLVFDAGERFLVDLANDSGEASIIHWHGQTPPPDQDGVTDTGYASPIAPGTRQRYDFTTRPGTHWMHSHHGLQEQALMAAPLIVRSAEDARLDAQEVTVLLHDFAFAAPAEVLARVTGGATMNHGASGGHAGHTMAGLAPQAGKADLNDFDYDAYLANDRTLADPQVIRTERNGRVRLRLINGATSTAFWIDLGSLTATVLAVDGNPVQPVTGQRFPLAQGQRLDLLVMLPAGGGAFPVTAQREGDRQRTGVILATPGATVARLGDLATGAVPAVDLSLEQRLMGTNGLPARPADVAHRITLSGSMMPYAWSIDDRAWSNRIPLRVTKGQRVVLEIRNTSAMAHPMHLHGHHFQVVGLNGRALAGAVRDTVLVPINATVSIAFDADNPGRWLLHCHNLFHMATGMMTELTYAEAA